MNFQQIVSLAPSITETIFALKQEHRLVGITDYCDFPTETNSKTRVGGFANPDVEAILKLNPDLILATGLHRPEKLAVFQEKNIAVKTVQAAKLTDSENVIRQIGKYLNVPEDANLLAAKIEEEFERLQKRVAQIGRIKVCYFCSFDPVCNWKNDCQMNELICMAGGEPIAIEKDRAAESILEANPQLILIPETNSGQSVSKLHKIIDSHPLITQTQAFRNGQVRSVNGSLLSRPGPRAASGFSLLIKAIHPELKDFFTD